MVVHSTGSNEYPRIFTREIDRPIFHEDMSSQMRRRLRTQRPDRVIGLARTRTFKHLLPSLRKRCSAFNKRHVLYPFIVIEAKAAENTSNASFGSMLRQTAFAVRTCMRLQQNLKDETGLDHQCLVWNFVILGEDWRLYAAVPDGDGVVSLLLKTNHGPYEFTEFLQFQSNCLTCGTDQFYTKMGHFNCS